MFQEKVLQIGQTGYSLLHDYRPSIKCILKANVFWNMFNVNKYKYRKNTNRYTLFNYIKRHGKQQCVKLALFHASSQLTPIALQIIKRNMTNSQKLFKSSFKISIINDDQ